MKWTIVNESMHRRLTFWCDEGSIFIIYLNNVFLTDPPSDGDDDDCRPPCMLYPHTGKFDRNQYYARGVESTLAASPRT